MAELFINTVVVFFIVLDPIGTSAIFSAMTLHAADDYRRRMALRGVVLSSAILLAFFGIGELLLQALGIGIPAFRIAGGILLFMLAIDMVFARQSGLRSTTDPERKEAVHRIDISVFPLAFPLIAGPGALTTVLLMKVEPTTVGETSAMLAGIVLVLAMTLAALLGARWLMRVLGETGANVVSRLLGLILAALAVQFVIDGLQGALANTGPAPSFSSAAKNHQVNDSDNDKGGGKADDQSPGIRLAVGV